MGENHKTVGTFASIFNLSRLKETSMLAHRQNTSMNLRSFISSCSYVTSTKLQYGYVVFAVVLYLVGLLHASTPEFKRGGVYLSGDVILGKIIFTTFKCISIIFEYPHIIER